MTKCLILDFPNSVEVIPFHSIFSVEFFKDSLSILFTCEGYPMGITITVNDESGKGNVMKWLEPCVNENLMIDMREANINV